MSSVLFQKVRNQKGLVYQISGFHKSFDDTGVFAFKFSVKEFKDLLTAMDIILNECQKLKTTLLNDSQINKIKTNLIGKLTLMKDSSYSMAEYLAIQYLNHPKKIYTLNDMTKIYNNITAKDINKISKQMFNFNKIKLSILGHSTINKNSINNILKTYQ